MGSSSEPFKHLSEPIGRLIAESGCHLLTGGGYGVMAEVSKAFCEVENRTGHSIGILRSSDLPLLKEKKQERRQVSHIVNPWVEIPILTHLPLSGEFGTDFMSRNHINVMASDLVIALPGGQGTFSEVTLRVQYRRPIVLFIGDEAINGKKATYFSTHPLFSKRMSIASSIEEVREQIAIIQKK